MASFRVLMELNEAAMALNVWNNPFAAARAYRRALEIIKEENASAPSSSLPLLEEATCCIDLAQIYLDHSPDGERDEFYPQALQLVESSKEILTKRGILQSQSSSSPTGDDNSDEKVNVLLCKYYVARGHALIANGQDAEGVKVWGEAAAVAAKASDLLLQIGSKLRGMGRPGEAIPYIKKSIEIDKQGNKDENSHDLAAAYSNLGCALADNGDHDEAIIAGKEFVRIMKHIHEKALSSGDGGNGQTLLEVSNACESLGTTYREAGNIDESVAMYREAIDVLKTSPYYETIECAEKHNSLGFVLEMLPDRLGDTRESCLEAIRILDACSPALGGISSHHEKAYYCIGSTYSKEEKWDDCIASWDKALTVQRELCKQQKVPPDLVVETCFKLIEASNNRAERRKQVEGEKVQEYRMEAYNMFVKHAPEEVRLQQQPFLVLCEEIAKWYKSKNSGGELCLEFMQQAADGWKKLAPDSIKAAMVSVAAGTAQHEVSDLDKALEHFEFALSVATGLTTGDDAASAVTCVGLSHYNIGNILHERGELHAALASCQKSLEAFRSLSGEGGGQHHPLLPKLLFSIGTIQQDQTLLNDAKTTLQDALNTHQQLSPDDGFLETVQKALEDLEKNE